VYGSRNRFLLFPTSLSRSTCRPICKMLRGYLSRGVPTPRSTVLPQTTLAEIATKFLITNPFITVLTTASYPDRDKPNPHVLHLPFLGSILILFSNQTVSRHEPHASRNTSCTKKTTLQQHHTDTTTQESTLPKKNYNSRSGYPRNNTPTYILILNLILIIYRNRFNQ
jgi:hypothetical protein